MATKNDLINSNECRANMLKKIAQQCKEKLALPKLPIHFFDRSGFPIHTIEKLLCYLAEQETPSDTLIYCQENILFRQDYIEN